MFIAVLFKVNKILLHPRILLVNEENVCGQCLITHCLIIRVEKLFQLSFSVVWMELEASALGEIS